MRRLFRVEARRRALGALVVGVATVAAGVFAVTGPSASAAGVPATATAASSWLGSQITANGGSLPGFVVRTSG